MERSLQIVELVKAMLPSYTDVDVVYSHEFIKPSVGMAPTEIQFNLVYDKVYSTSFKVSEADTYREIINKASQGINLWVGKCIKEMVDTPRWHWDDYATTVLVTLNATGNELHLEYTNDALLELKLDMHDFKMRNVADIANLLTGTIDNRKKL